jgi:hypothetical protein
MLQKYWRLFVKTTVSLKKLIRKSVFEKNAIFSAENGQKAQKIVIITLTPDWANFPLLGDSLLWVVFW